MIITNPFTGEKRVNTAQQIKAQTQKDMDDAEQREANPERPGILRPKSLGRSYNFEESKTDQAGKDDCDLNKIMKRYEKTGNLTELIKRGDLSDAGRYYGDFSEAPTYQEACNIVIHAESQFSNLDAQLRKRFDHDPEKFLEFINDPKNGDEAIKLGLAAPRAPKEPPKTQKQAQGTKKEAGKGGEDGK